MEEKMKTYGIVFLIVALTGCASSGNRIKGYLDDPVTILEDPVSVDHQEALDDLERSYLHKEISYAEYLEQKGRLEDSYAQQINKRQKIIEETGTTRY